MAYIAISYPYHVFMFYPKTRIQWLFPKKELPIKVYVTKAENEKTRLFPTFVLSCQIHKIYPNVNIMT